MGIFTKETRTVFRRDEAGAVDNVEHIGNAAINAERIDQRRGDRTARWNSFKGNIRNDLNDRVQRRALEKAAYKEEYHKARIERAKRGGREAGLHGGFSSMVFNPPVNKGKKKKGNMVWHDPFSTPYRNAPVKKNKAPSFKYAVVGGKAYKVANIVRNKKKSYTNPVDSFLNNIPRF